MKPKVAFVNNVTENFHRKPGSAIERVYGHGRRERLEELAEVYPHLITSSNFDEHSDALAGIEAIFTTWGMPSLQEEQIDKLKSLKILFHAAGATPYRGPYVERGVTVCSASAANAMPVAEFCLMQIMMCATNVLNNMAGCNNLDNMRKQLFGKGRGAYGAKVTLLGKGSIAKHLMQLLEPFDFDVEVIGSRQIMQDTSVLKEVFSESYIVSNHLPDREDNRKIINGALFELMPEGASFINTGRGEQVDEAEMVEVFSKRPDLTAMLDVQAPEPPVEDSPLFTTPNIHLTRHIAGAMNDEYLRLSDFMIEDFERWLKGDPLQHEVQEDML